MGVLESPGKVLDFFVSKRVGTISREGGKGRRHDIQMRVASIIVRLRCLFLTYCWTAKSR